MTLNNYSQAKGKKIKARKNKGKESREVPNERNYVSTLAQVTSLSAIKVIKVKR